jgi:hypothetical protein
MPRRIHRRLHSSLARLFCRSSLVECDKLVYHYDDCHKDKDSKRRDDEDDESVHI